MKQNIQTRFFKKIEYSNHFDDDCWYWTSTNHKDGYGQFKLNSKSCLAHRISYELFRGKIPIGLQLDHLCRNRKCVNPNHLEIVSNRENVLRGVSVCAINYKKTHCKHGHKFDEKNTYFNKNKNRRCRFCVMISQRKHRGALV